MKNENNLFNEPIHCASEMLQIVLNFLSLFYIHSFWLVPRGSAEQTEQEQGFSNHVRCKHKLKGQSLLSFGCSPSLTRLFVPRSNKLAGCALNKRIKSFLKENSNLFINTFPIDLYLKLILLYITINSKKFCENIHQKISH